jgi:hypothetical protein
MNNFIVKKNPVTGAMETHPAPDTTSIEEQLKATKKALRSMLSGAKPFHDDRPADIDQPVALSVERTAELEAEAAAWAAAGRLDTMRKIDYSNLETRANAWMTDSPFVEIGRALMVGTEDKVPDVQNMPKIEAARRAALCRDSQDQPIHEGDVLVNTSGAKFTVVAMAGWASLGLRWEGKLLALHSAISRDLTVVQKPAVCDPELDLAGACFKAANKVHAELEAHREQLRKNWTTLAFHENLDGFIKS